MLDDFFPFFKKIGFGGILGPPYYGIGATIRISREMLCLPYAGLFSSSMLHMTHILSVYFHSFHAELAYVPALTVNLI